MKIPRDKIQVKSVRSSGPGGQHVNKTATKVELRFTIESAKEWMKDSTWKRFQKLNENKINKDGDFILHCDESRSQKQNTEKAFYKLEELLKQASIAPKPRKKTQTPLSSKHKRREDKNKRSKLKESRKKPESQD